MIMHYLKSFDECEQITIVGPLLSEELIQEDPIIFVDGAVIFKTQPQIGYSIGDGDSSFLQLDQSIDPQKDLSDLAYVLRQLSSHFKSIDLKGFLGGRKDHELMNFAEVHQFLKTRTNTTVALDSSIIVKSAGKWTIKFKGTFSLFCFGETIVTLQGDCDYTLIEKPLKSVSSHGLSNYSKGLIELENNNPVFIFLNP
ncbi:MAG: hypothetical protein H6625_09030 [Bdellovibrionaceae bacterium]|nr:hypothetical protein [Pseudobdellovibrionaceae bacterium]